MKRVRTATTKLVGFIGIPILNGVVPLLALPSITSAFGATGWTAVALAQSIGQAGSVLVELGWGLTGSQMIARKTLKGQRALLVLATATKLLALVPVSTIAVVAAMVLVPGYRLEAALIAICGCAASLNTAWYFIGTGSPWGIIASDTLPRLVPMIMAAILIADGWPLVTYVVASLLPVFLAPILAFRRAGAPVLGVFRVRPRLVLCSIAAQRSALAGRALSAVYIALPVTLVGIAAPASVAVFAGAERLQRMALTGLQAVPSALQGWVGRPAEPSIRRQRARQAILINGGVGLAAGVGFALLAGPVSEVIFSSVATMDGTVVALCGSMILIVSISRATGGIMLVVLGNVRAIAWSALAGCVVGVPAIVILGRALGPAGGILGEICAEASVLLVQLLAIGRDRRDPDGVRG